MPHIVDELRPAEVILACWREVLWIEEDAEVFQPDYLEVTQ